MANETNSVAPVSSDYEAILPIGWADGDDIFNPASWSGETPDADAQTGSTGTLEELLAADPVVPTTDDVKSASDETDSTDEDATTTGDPATETAPATGKLRFTARYNHADQNVEIDEADLPTIYQKALYADQARAELDKAKATMQKAEQLARKMEYKSAAEMIEDAEKNFLKSDVESYVAKGLSEEEATEVVEAKYAKRLADTTEPTPTEDTTVESRKSEFDADVKFFFEAHPELRSEKVPEEVVQATLGGEHFHVAYQKYLNQKAAAEKAALQKETRIQKQNAESSAKAPVRGVRGGGNAATTPQNEFERLFLQGFNTEY